MIWVGVIFSPLIMVLDFYTKEPDRPKQGKKQKFNHSMFI